MNITLTRIVTLTSAIHQFSFYKYKLITLPNKVIKQQCFSYIYLYIQCFGNELSALQRPHS